MKDDNFYKERYPYEVNASYRLKIISTDAINIINRTNFKVNMSDVYVAKCIGKIDCKHPVFKLLIDGMDKWIPSNEVKVISKVIN